MKRKSFLLVVSLVMTLILPTPTYAQFGKLKGLGNKVKEKVKESTKNKGKDIGNISEEVGNISEVAEVAGESASTTQSQAPWPMSNNPTYNGKDVRTFLYTLADESDEYLTSLREDMYSRYKSNAKIINSMGNGSYEAQTENQNLMRLYYEILTIVQSNVGNVHINNGAKIRW